MFDTPTPGPALNPAERRLLVSYDNYAAAQRTVDALSDAGFPVQNLAIIGSDLRLEEKVTGRLTNGRAALTGAGSGAVFGLIVGLFLGLFTDATTTFFALVLWSILWGAVAGAAFGFASHAFQGGTRDFTSRSQIVAGRYDVLVTPAALEQAQAILSGGMTPADTVVVQRPPTAGTVPTHGSAGGTGYGAPAPGSVPPPVTDGYTAEHEIPAQRTTDNGWPQPPSGLRTTPPNDMRTAPQSDPLASRENDDLRTSAENDLHPEPEPDDVRSSEESDLGSSRRPR